MCRALAWMCLLLVATATAYGLQLSAASLVPIVAAADQVSSPTVTSKVLIVAVDPVTGQRAQVVCDAPLYSFASDVLLVDAKEFAAVATKCNGPTTAGVQP